MQITKQRLIEIIKEEIGDEGLAPVPLHKGAGKNQSFSPPSSSPAPASDPTVQDLMFKIEKLMSRIDRLEKTLNVKPSPREEDGYGDTDYAELPDRVDRK
jgi:hypothetical protein